jgi:uncharacterized cupredoxin-like copper-binding protein
MKHVRIAAIAAALPLAGLALVACGDDDTTASSDDGTRTIEIEMTDIAFEPETVEVAEGETVRFVFTNSGAVVHDAVIGDEQAQADHEAEMREEDEDEGHGGGGHGEDEDDALTVEPGETGELTHTFDEAGETFIGCHQPGHYEAGMVVTVDVT